MAKKRKIEQVAEIEHDEDGWWAWYQDGWKSCTDPVGVQHFDHEDTKKEIMQLVRDAIACDCDACMRSKTIEEIGDVKLQNDPC